MIRRTKRDDKVSGAVYSQEITTAGVQLPAPAMHTQLNISAEQAILFQYVASPPQVETDTPDTGLDWIR